MSSVTWRLAQGGPIKHTHTQHIHAHLHACTQHTTTPTTTVSGLKYPASLTAYFIIIRGEHTHTHKLIVRHIWTETIMHTHTDRCLWRTHTHTRVYTYINIDVWVFQSEEKQWSTQMSIRVLFTHVFWFWDTNFKCFCITDTAKLYVPPAKCQSDSESLCLCQIEDVRVTSKDRRHNISLQYTWLWSAAKRGKLWVFSCWRHPRASLTAPHLYFWDKCEIYFTVLLHALRANVKRSEYKHKFVCSERHHFQLLIQHFEWCLKLLPDFMCLMKIRFLFNTLRLCSAAYNFPFREK